MSKQSIVREQGYWDISFAVNAVVINAPVGWGRLAQLGEWSSTNPAIRVQFRAKPKNLSCWGEVSCTRGNNCATKFIVKILTQFNKIWYWRSRHLLEESELYTISTEQKGNVAWTNRSCDVIHLVMSDVISLYYATLQPLHHQPTHLNTVEHKRWM